MNFFWIVYKGLEKELLKIADVVNIDDHQSSVYSVKMAELLLRTAVEIESISKRLYQMSGGEKTTDFAYFDEDCIAHLNKEWRIEHRYVTVSSPYIHLSEEMRTFAPLKNCSKKGEGTWKKAYQAVKHDREANYTQATILNFIKSLGALYLLNIYYRNLTVDMEKDPFAKFDCTCGSEIFSIMVDVQVQYGKNGREICGEGCDHCTYIIRAKPEKLEKVNSAVGTINEEIARRARKVVEEKLANGEPMTKEDINKIVNDLRLPTAREYYKILHEATQGLQYEAVLNKLSVNPQHEAQANQPETKV